MSHPRKDLSGRTFDHWKVLHPAEKPDYWTCRCDCGSIVDVAGGQLRRGISKSCRKCSNARYGPKRSEAILEKRKAQYIGQTVNGWRILDVYRSPEERNLFCAALCPSCGEKANLRITFLKNTSKCARCTNNLKRSAEAIAAHTDVDGSNLISVQLRVDGKVNKNSTTGVNGVFYDRGKYRAHIFFKGKRRYLGSYDNLQDAAAARKMAEDLLYAPYLEAHEGWQEDLKKALDELKKQK